MRSMAFDCRKKSSVSSEFWKKLDICKLGTVRAGSILYPLSQIKVTRGFSLGEEGFIKTKAILKDKGRLKRDVSEVLKYDKVVAIASDHQ